MNANTVPPLRLTENTTPTLRGMLGNAWLMDLEAVGRPPEDA